MMTDRTPDTVSASIGPTATTEGAPAQPSDAPAQRQSLKQMALDVVRAHKGDPPSVQRRAILEATGRNIRYTPHCGARERQRWIAQQARATAKAAARAARLSGADVAVAGLVTAVNAVDAKIVDNLCDPLAD